MTIMTIQRVEEELRDIQVIRDNFIWEIGNFYKQKKQNEQTRLAPDSQEPHTKQPQTSNVSFSKEHDFKRMMNRFIKIKWRIEQETVPSSKVIKILTTVIKKRK